MKVKEVNLTACVAWSPKWSGVPHLACATAAKHADPASKADSIQVYSMNLQEYNLNLKLAGSVSTNTKFHEIKWGSGTPQVGGSQGVLACAGDDGGIYLYDGEKLKSGSNASLLTSMENKHAGSVYSLDFNHHQHNMLATGSKDCEIFIWDINDPTTPMSPATKATLAADVTCVVWNKQVEKILASCYGGRCVVFDCQKSKSIFQISEAVSRVKANTVCWHPSVATQLALSSYDDNTPVLQIWDLRYANGPLRQCEGHQRGIQSMVWCADDPDLLLTAAKDNRVLCWNPNTGECVCELPSYNQWSFDVDWCPRDPALVSAATVDGSVSVYSMLGGGYAPPRDFKFSAIADSFPGMDMPIEVPAAAQPQFVYPLKSPAFIKRTSGCSFGFGGRLLSWDKDSRAVTISQVVTETDLVNHSNELLGALQNANLSEYCTTRQESVPVSSDKEMWQYINAGLYPGNEQFLSLLGYPPPPPANVEGVLTPPQEGLASQMAGMGVEDIGSSASLDPSEQFELIAQCSDKMTEPEILDAPTPPIEEQRPLEVTLATEGKGGAIRKAIMSGQYEEAIELCLKSENFSIALILAQHANIDLFLKTRDRVLSLEEDSSSVGGMVKAIVTGSLQTVVTDSDIKEWRETMVTIITHSPSQEEASQLLGSLGSKLESNNNLQAALLCYIISGSLESFVQCWVKTKNAADGDLPTTELQNLVELILVLQQSGRCNTTGSSESVGQYLAVYASLLATQGALATAYQYLASNSNLQGELAALKDRLSHSLGYSGSVSTNRNRNTSTSSAQSRGYRRTSTPGSHQPAQFTPSVQAQQANTFSHSQPPAPQPSFYQPQGGMNPPQPGQMFAPPGQPQQPPSSYGSFQPAPPPTASSMPPPPSMGLPPTAPPGGSSSTPGGLRRPGMQSRYVSAVSTQPTATPFTPFQPSDHQQPPNTFQPINSNPSYPEPSIAEAFDPSFSSQQAGGEQYAAPSKPPAAFDSSVPRGWNDPPAFSSSRRSSSSSILSTAPGVEMHSGSRRLHNLKTKAKPQAAATEEINAMVPTQMQPMVPPPMAPTAPMGGFQGFQGFQAQGVGAPPPSSFQPPAAVPSAPPSSQTSAPSAPLGPIPAEAKAVHDVFSRLYGRAMQMSPNASTQQALQMIGPKLEVLYDKLRAGQLTSKTLGGLQAICKCIEAGDYHSALQAHSQTLTQGNFAEMSAFMPHVKKLVTTCMQCQIFL